MVDATPLGLTADEAARRLAHYGPNVIEARHRLHALAALLKKFTNPLVIVLLCAAGISGVTGDVASFIIITVMVLIGVVLDFIQEYQAENAAEALRQSVALTVSVSRAGRLVRVPASTIVPGDIVHLEAGALVPADGHVCSAQHIFVNQALLTGESYPVEKMPRLPTTPEADTDVPASMVVMGSSVVSGSALIEIEATGRKTRLGTIAAALNAPPPPTAFEVGIRQFGLLIVRLTVLLALFVLLVNLALHRPPLESFLFAVALAVGLTPELLPMVVSVSLARGAQRMSRQRVIVKRLSAIHDLGAMDILCTDKTGTLTEARIDLIDHVSVTGLHDDRVLLLGALNSHFETGIKSPLDDAILHYCQQQTSVQSMLAAWRKLDEVPFDFERRRVSVLLANKADTLLILKGAPEDVMALATRTGLPGDGELPPFAGVVAERAQQLFVSLSRQGYRLLAIAWRPIDSARVKATASDENDLVLAGFCAFVDPPKQSARMTLAALREQAVSIKILSGDNELVTAHLCETLGLPPGEIMLGDTLASLSDEALLARVESTHIFCRVNPQQKHRIILALKRRGHTVGFVGDGINDAPSLHAADVGISVDDAADVAKQAAAMIMLDKDLGVLTRGITEGRRTFVNIQKYIMMGTSSNFGNMLSMALASLFLPFLPMLPVQVLLNNLLYDLSEVPIPLDRVDAEQILRPLKWDMRFIQRFMLVFGPISSLFDMLTFAVLIWGLQAAAPEFRTGWFVESLATQSLVIFVIRSRRAAWRSRPQATLALTTIAVVLIGALLPATKLGHWFGLVGLPWQFQLVVIGLVVAYLALAEAVKQWFFRRALVPGDNSQS